MAITEDNPSAWLTRARSMALEQLSQMLSEGAHSFLCSIKPVLFREVNCYPLGKSEGIKTGCNSWRIKFLCSWRRSEKEGEGWMKGSSVVLGRPGVIRQLGFLLELQDGARSVQALCAPPRRAHIQSPPPPRCGCSSCLGIHQKRLDIHNCCESFSHGAVGSCLHHGVLYSGLCRSS